MVHFGHHFPGKIARSIVFYSTSVPARNSEPDEPDEPDEAGNGVSKCSTDLPCHRAGGKDYGSFTTNSLKLLLFLFPT